MKKRVLIVDDEPQVIDGLKRALRKEPYEILWAYSGAEALEILVREEIDVLVSDEMMPGMSGSELLSRVRRMFPQTIRVMLTGRANVESAMSAIYDGWVYQYLHKPVNAADLASVLHNGLLLQSLRMENESPHLMMSHEQQNELLSEVSGRPAPSGGETVTEEVSVASPPPLPSEPVSDVAAVAEKIQSALARAERAATIEDLLAEVHSAIEDVESGTFS